MTIEKKQIEVFQTKILSWYETHKRDLPWRKTSDPYAILVSEVMSQQTQILRVVPKYLAWLEAFPTSKALAKASVSEVLMHWSGLGYNRRALNLQKTAKVLAHDYNGLWPKTPEELEKLPGIGKYTASAVACFAFNAQIPVIDTNIRKVILVTFGNRHCEESANWRTTKQSNLREDCRASLAMTENDIEEIAWQLLPVGKAKDWNQALMDYAGAELKKEKIAIPKQSTFMGSKRWYRGNLLKLLTQQKNVSPQQLEEIWQKDIFGKDNAWFETLVYELEEEGFITVQKQNKKIIHLCLTS